MKTVVITGSARGLGLEMAKEFRRNNCNVVISDLKEENLMSAKATLENINSEGKILTCICDVSKYDNLENLLNKALAEFNDIDIWINNAGVNQNIKVLFIISKGMVQMMLICLA